MLPHFRGPNAQAVAVNAVRRSSRKACGPSTISLHLYLFILSVYISSSPVMLFLLSPLRLCCECRGPAQPHPSMTMLHTREVLQRWISPFWHSQVTHVCIHKRLGSVGHAYALLDARDIRVSGTTISITLDIECIGQCNLSA
jgi:hypothetical protein